MCPITACLISETTGTTPLEETNVSTVWRLWSPRLWDQAISRKVYYEEENRMAGINPNIDFCGIRNLLHLLEGRGFSKTELKKISARIAANIGADIIFVEFHGSN